MYENIRKNTVLFYFGNKILKMRFVFAIIFVFSQASRLYFGQFFKACLIFLEKKYNLKALPGDFFGDQQEVYQEDMMDIVNEYAYFLKLFSSIFAFFIS